MAEGAKTLVIWGRCFRLSLLPTAMADGLAGFAIAGLTEFPMDSKLLLFVCSAGIYHGAMGLNDWADRVKDKTERPERPIPSGALRANSVLSAAIALVTLGVASAFSLDFRLGLWMTGIATLAVAYDLFLRGPLLGPLCLAICRAMHMAAPALWLAPERLMDYWYLPAGYGAYVFSVSRLARLEEKTAEELGSTPSKMIFLQTACFAVPLAAALLKHELSSPLTFTFLATAGAVILVKQTLGSSEWNPARVQASVGTALRLLLVYSAACALTGGGSYGFIAAALILLGYPLAHSLRKVFPPT